MTIETEPKKTQWSNVAGFFKKLRTGQYGLGITFWVFAFFLPLTVNVILESALFTGMLGGNNFGKFIFVCIYFVFFFYVISALLGVWTAAQSYGGNEAWVFLAKGYVIVASAIVVLFLVYISKFLFINLTA